MSAFKRKDGVCRKMDIECREYWAKERKFLEGGHLPGGQCPDG